MGVVTEKSAVPASISSRFVGFAFGLLLTLQSALVLTGGAVRVTGSGLGCPTWPECTPGSYTPQPDQEEDQLHVWIEFGNRLLTFALVIASIIVLSIVLKKRRRDLRNLALLQVLGILGQGLLGGITVLTDLHPAPVAGHLLLSMALIAGAASLYDRRKVPSLRKKEISRKTLRLSTAHIWLTFIVLILGTVVTGSGPHAGDEKAQRFGFDIRTVSILHADAVIALVFLTVGFYLLSDISPRSVRAVSIFLAIALSQGVIGYIQYFLGVPEALVIAHLLGATLVWISSWRIRTSIVRESII